MNRSSDPSGRQRPKSQNIIGNPRFDIAPQSPQYEVAVESLPPITGHAANSRKDSCPFSNALGSFLFSTSTLCIFAGPPLSPGSAKHTKIPEDFWSRTLIANLFTP